MARVSLFIATLLLAAGLSVCGRQAASSQQIVILIDVSDSIESAAEQEAFAAVDRLVSQLHRGDKIAIIPITGDAQAETSGRVIRFDVPTERQAYDNDLRQFRNKLKTSLIALQARVMANPGEHTDILGSIILAQQEFKFTAGASKRSLVILSDFIQDDTELSFLKDKRLANTAAARAYAMQWAKNGQLDFRGAPVYLGLLRSKDYRNLGRSRREAIQEFWLDYFNSCGGQTVFATDGTGLLGNFAEGQIDRRK